MPTLADIGAVPLSEMREELRHAARGVPLWGRDGVVRAFTMVDADDYPLVSLNRWFRLSAGAPYAVRYEGGRPPKRRAVWLHRLLGGLRQGDPRQVDHINRDKLDNRKANLRIVTEPENLQNKPAYKGSTSTYRGVSRYRDGRRWIGQAQLDGKKVYVGLFEDELEAAEAVLAWRREHMPFAID
jgi:hypothetical protein